MSGTHAILSPSKGAMILRCAASLAAGKNVPNPPSEYAAEGTAYHDVAAKTLENLRLCDIGIGDSSPRACADFVGQVVEADGFKFTIDEENAAHAQTYVDAIRRLPGVQHYEVRLDTSEVVGVPDQGGTGDAVTLDFEHDTIHVDDLKFGRGEVVFAENNEQLIQYGAAALRKYALMHDWKFLKLGIHQPRIGHYSEHTMSVEEVEAWIAANKPKFQLAFMLYNKPETLTPAHFTPGDKQCRWCPIKGSCAARTNAMLQQFPLSPPAPAQPAIITLTDDELAAARDRVDAIEQWCSDIKAEAHTRGVILGKTLPGWKVVMGRAGNRKWLNEKFAEEILTQAVGDAAYRPREIVTPTQAQKVLKNYTDRWDAIQDYIGQSEGSKSLVRDDSPKQAVNVPTLEFPISPV